MLYRLEQSSSAVTSRHMFTSELVSLSRDLSSGAVGAGERSVARRVAPRLFRSLACFARWRALSGAQKSVFEGRAALGTCEKS